MALENENEQLDKTATELEVALCEAAAKEAQFVAKHSERALDKVILVIVSFAALALGASALYRIMFKILPDHFAGEGKSKSAPQITETERTDPIGDSRPGMFRQTELRVTKDLLRLPLGSVRFGFIGSGYAENLLPEANAACSPLQGKDTFSLVQNFAHENGIERCWLARTCLAKIASGVVTLKLEKKPQLSKLWEHGVFRGKLVGYELVSNAQLLKHNLHQFLPHCSRWKQRVEEKGRQRRKPLVVELGKHIKLPQRDLVGVNLSTDGVLMQQQDGLTGKISLFAQKEGKTAAELFLLPGPQVHSLQILVIDKARRGQVLKQRQNEVFHEFEPTFILAGWANEQL